MTAETITLDREKTLAAFEAKGRMTALLDRLEQGYSTYSKMSIDSEMMNELVTKMVTEVVDAYRQMLMNEANESITPEIPTEAEVDEMDRARTATRKAGRAPHEL